MPSESEGLLCAASITVVRFFRICYEYQGEKKKEKEKVYLILSLSVSLSPLHNYRMK
jgi:hypothetical protein